MELIRRGSTGPIVAEIRSKLGALGFLGDPSATEHDDAVFDDACDRAVRGFQQERGLRVDGIVGPETYRALDEARWRLGDRVLSHGASRLFVGDDVAELQHRLLQLGFDPGRCDGMFGSRTEAALREFQRNIGLPADGTCGPRTLKALHRLARTVVGGSPERIREEEQLLAAGPTPAGKFVVIDPGHGGDDPGGEGHGLAEAAVVWDLANRLEGRLGATGVTAFLTRGPDANPSDSDRAAFANEAHADLFLSLHVDRGSSPKCHGAATYYYGTAERQPAKAQPVQVSGRPHARSRGTGSAVGARLAGLIQHELTERTDLLDCRTHPKTWELLRLTRMPAVRVEVGYLSHAGDAARLASPEFRDTVAEAIVAAVHRLYLTPELEELRSAGSAGLAAAG